MEKNITISRKEFKYILTLLGTLADILGDESNNQKSSFGARQLAKSGHFGVKKVIEKYEIL